MHNYFPKNLFKQSRFVYQAGGEAPTPPEAEAGAEAPRTTPDAVKKKLNEYTKRFNDFKKELEEKAKSKDPGIRQRAEEALHTLEQIVDPSILETQTYLSPESIRDALKKFQYIIDDYRGKASRRVSAKPKAAPRRVPKAAPAVAPAKAPKTAPVKAPEPVAERENREKELIAARGALQRTIADANVLAARIREHGGGVPDDLNRSLREAQTAVERPDVKAILANIAALEKQIKAAAAWARREYPQDANQFNRVALTPKTPEQKPSVAPEKVAEGREGKETSEQKLKRSIDAARNLAALPEYSLSAGQLAGLAGKAEDALRTGDPKFIATAQRNLDTALKRVYASYSEKERKKGHKPLTIAELASPPQRKPAAVPKKKPEEQKVAIRPAAAPEQKVAQREPKKKAEKPRRTVKPPERKVTLREARDRTLGKTYQLIALRERFRKEGGAMVAQNFDAAINEAKRALKSRDIASIEAAERRLDDSIDSGLKIWKARFPYKLAAADLPTIPEIRPVSAEAVAAKGGETVPKTGEAPSAAAPEGAKTAPQETREQKEEGRYSPYENAWTYMAGTLRDVPVSQLNDEGFRSILSFQIEANPKAREIVQNILINSTIADEKHDGISDLPALYKGLRAERGTAESLTTESMQVLCSRIAEPRFFDLEATVRAAITAKAQEEFTAASADKPAPYTANRTITYEGVTWKYRARKNENGTVEVAFAKVRAPAAAKAEGAEEGAAAEGAPAEAAPEEGKPSKAEGRETSGTFDWKHAIGVFRDTPDETVESEEFQGRFGEYLRDSEEGQQEMQRVLSEYPIQIMDADGKPIFKPGDNPKQAEIALRQALLEGKVFASSMQGLKRAVLGEIPLRTEAGQETKVAEGEEKAAVPTKKFPLIEPSKPVEDANPRERSPERKPPTIDGLTPTQIVAYMAGQDLDEIRVSKENSYNYYQFKHAGLRAGIAIMGEDFIRFNVNDAQNPIWEITAQKAFNRDKFLAGDMARILITVKRQIEKYKKTKKV
jgi:hypothetical protein